jgi:hypothetical protein
MKRIIITIVLSAFTFGAFAQISKEDMAIVQAHFQKDKKELVTQVMKLNEAQGQAFWPVYDEYETKRAALSTQRIGIINDYLKAYKSITDQDATALMGRLFANDKSLADLQKEFYTKFSAAIGGKSAAKFYQLEYYVQSIVKEKVMTSLPVIGHDLNQNAAK